MESRLSLAMQSLKVKNVGKAGPAGEDAFLSDKGQLGKQQAEIPNAAYKAKTCLHQRMHPQSYRSAPCELFFRLYYIATHYIKPTWRRSLGAGSQSITTKLFDSITCTSDHKLHELLPPRNNSESNLRRKRNFNIPLAKTKGLKNTFIYHNCN